MNLSEDEKAKLALIVTEKCFYGCNVEEITRQVYDTYIESKKLIDTFDSDNPEKSLYKIPRKAQEFLK